MSHASSLSGGAALLLSAVCAAPVLAQRCEPGLVEEGIEAYRSLRLPEATELLERAAPTEDDGSSCAEGERTLTYLGAAQLFRGMNEEAEASFRRSVLFNPRYEPDTLAFPPEVTELYDRVRRNTRSVALEVPRTSSLSPGSDSVRVRVFATSDYPVRVSLAEEGAVTGGVTLYDGPGADSLEVFWSGLGSAGEPLAPGRYVLTATPAGAENGADRVTLVASRPAGAVSGRRGSAWDAALPLGQALLAGSAAVAMHELIDPEGGGARYRFAIAGAIGAAGIIGAAQRLLGWGDAAPTGRVLIRRVPAEGDVAADSLLIRSGSAR